MTFYYLFGALLFGSIGLVAFMIGKKRSSAVLMVVGIALMGYPYLISNTVLMYSIGVLLTLALFILRRY